MTLYFEEEGDLNLPIECRNFAEQIILASLEYIHCPYEVEVNLLLTQDEEIQKMNKEFRDIDKETDVLSFPMIEYESPGNFTVLEDMEDVFEPESGELLLGDIVISKNRVLAQAKEYGHGVKREYAFLIAHSMLHLFGYDHMEEKERLLMEQKQEEILEQLHIVR
ncbi:MAG: rRNA maturation RNase YbeY [Lachnospiraceae bacterium]